MSVKVDPITLDIIENALKNARFEMDGVVVRISLSPVIREQHDEFPMICNERGQMVVGQFGSYIPAIVQQFENDINDGDIFVWNDPYACKGSISHNNDWCVMMPIFHDSVLVGFSSIFGHMVDVGGKVPGSMPCDSRTIWEEGLRIPPVRIYDKGVLNKGVLDIMLNNTRTPDMNRADLMALIAGCRTAATRVRELCDRFGRDTYMAACDMLLDRTREAMKVLIQKYIPEEPVTFTDYVDDDGLGNGPFKMTLSIYRRGEMAVFDWTGTDPQAEGPDQLSHSRRPLQAVLRRLHDHGLRSVGAVQRRLLRSVRDDPAGRLAAQSALSGRRFRTGSTPTLASSIARPERSASVRRICRWPQATAPARISFSPATPRTTNTSS